MLKIAVCDDNEKTLKVLDKCLVREFSAFNEEISVRLYTEADALRKDILSDCHYDLLFLDVDMPYFHSDKYGKCSD